MESGMVFVKRSRKRRSIVVDWGDDRNGSPNEAVTVTKAYCQNIMQVVEDIRK